MVKPRRYKHYEMFQCNTNAKDKAVVSLYSNIYTCFININIYIQGEYKLSEDFFTP